MQLARSARSWGSRPKCASYNTIAIKKRHESTTSKPVAPPISNTPCTIPDELVEPPKNFKQSLVPLDWQHDTEKKKIPMELLEFQKAVKKELQAKEQMALEITKMPDYQFYHLMLRERIERVEQNMEKSGMKFTHEYRKITDKLIEEVIYTTQEEFHAYYKARDERFFAVIEDRMRRLNGRYDPNFVKFLTEGEEKYLTTEEKELLLLKQTMGVDPWEEQQQEEDEEPDSDEVASDQEIYADTPFQQLLAITAKMIEEDKAKAEAKKPPPTTFVLDESPTMIEPVYKDYEKIELWKREREDSPFAGIDRIRAHFQARDREKINRMKAGNQPPDEMEEITSFFQYLETDPGAKGIFTRLSERESTGTMDPTEAFKDLPNLNEKQPDMDELAKMGSKLQRETGLSSELQANQNILNNLRNQAKASSGQKHNGRKKNK